MTSTSSVRRSWLLALAVLVVAAALLVALFGRAGSGQVGASDPIAAPAGDGFAPVVARALPSVVQIRSARGLGSGIVFDDAGHVVTNAHVVAGSTAFTVTLADGSQHKATLRGAFPQGDLAVVELQGARPKPAMFADSSKLKVGEYALAIGNPLGLRSSVTQGIVSSTSRTVGEGSGVALPSVIQTSAPINPGNSGGALVDASGAVIGIPTLAASDPQIGGAADGIGFAISSNTARSIASQLAAHGKVQHSGRAWLGVELRTAPDAGVVVASVTPDGPAAKAGVRPGDLIVRAGGHPTPSVDDLALVLAGTERGQTLLLQLQAPAGARSAKVTLGELPAGS